MIYFFQLATSILDVFWRNSNAACETKCLSQSACQKSKAEREFSGSVNIQELLNLLTAATASPQANIAVVFF